MQSDKSWDFYGVYDLWRSVDARGNSWILTKVLTKIRFDLQSNWVLLVITNQVDICTTRPGYLVVIWFLPRAYINIKCSTKSSPSAPAVERSLAHPATSVWPTLENPATFKVKTVRIFQFIFEKLPLPPFPPFSRVEILPQRRFEKSEDAPA